MCNAWCLDFVRDSLRFWVANPVVLEVGSRDVNGSARSVCASLAKTYVGVDIAEGNGVDTILDASKLAEHFGASVFDVVLSTEMVEHVYDWTTVLFQMMSVLKPDGILVLTTRSVGFEIHDHPADYWRYSKEDMVSIFGPVGEILALADDLTLGCPCGVGLVVRRKEVEPNLEQWRNYLCKSVRLYNVNLSNRISFEEYQLQYLDASQNPRSVQRKNVLEFPFDQYQRYHIIQEVIDLLRWRTPLSVLDVGGSPATLVHFLPHDRVIVADRADQGGLHLYASGIELPFEDAAFDVVVTSDTLEHILPAYRTRFLSELGRVAREAVIVGAPFDAPAVVQVEEVFQSLIWARYGQGYHFIEEHRRYGLPELDGTEQLFRHQGFQTAVLPNGYLHRWLVAISTFFLLQWRFDDPRLNARANAYYNANFYRADSRDPSYRKIIVATRTRDVSTLRENLCSDLPADETDRLAQFQILDLLVHALTEGWSERALVLQSQLAAQTEKVNTLVAQVVERQHAVETLTAQLAAQTDKVNELAAQIGERQHAVEGLTAELNAIQASKFWKLISLWQSLLRRLR